MFPAVSLIKTRIPVAVTQNLPDLLKGTISVLRQDTRVFELYKK